MKTKDYLIVALAPLPVLLIPLIGNLASPSNWKWTGSDFVVAYCLLASVTFVYRLLATRKWSNVTYKLAAGLAVATGFFLTWINLAVQIIGDENPAFVLYFVVVLIGLTGVGLSRFSPAGMAKAAYATAAATFLVPVIAYFAWPVDFSPGVVPVFFLNGCFVAGFAVSGLLFRLAARQVAAAA